MLNHSLMGIQNGAKIDIQDTGNLETDLKFFNGKIDKANTPPRFDAEINWLIGQHFFCY
jgi:hypothetical protein